MPDGSQTPLFVIGFMAAGKSTVGRLLAARLGRRFVDLDEEIETRVGQSVPEIFRHQGEPAFRAHEAAALAAIVGQRDVVVACGGGTPVAGDNFARMRAAGVVVALRARFETVLERALVPGGPTRPMLDGGEARARELFAARAEVYTRADLIIDTDGRPPDEVADEAARRARLRLGQVSVLLGERSYPVHLAPLGELGVLTRELLGAQATRVVIVTDTHVAAAGHAERARAALAAAGIASAIVSIPAGEAEKTVTRAEAVARACLAEGLDRTGAIIAVGGGVVSDLAGYVAASYMRGVPWLVVPTTLLAMVDAAIGGKTAVDVGQAKNLFGAFWQPRAVLADVSTLATLPRRELVAAFGEVVKYALLAGAPSLDAISLELAALPELVRACAAQKARVVSVDEHERTGARAALNLGHTVGHALEALSWGGPAPLLHGEAIALGLVACARVSTRRGLAPATLEAQVASTLTRLGLPTDLDGRLAAHPDAALTAALGLDKKRAGASLRYIALAAPGEVRTLELTPAELVQTLRA